MLNKKSQVDVYIERSGAGPCRDAVSRNDGKRNCSEEGSLN